MRIVCATDFSEPARAAVDLAAGLGRLLGDRVLLAHVVELPPVLGADLPPGEARWEEVLREAAERELGRSIERLQAAGVAAEARVLVGPIADHIRDLCAEPGVRLAVLGTHGRKGAAHFFLGSVTEDVARSADCPVIATKGLPPAGDGLAGHRRLHLMVAVNGTPASEAALAWVKTLRASVPCDLTLVQPCWPPAEAERFGLPEGWEGRQIHPALLPLLERELLRWVGTLAGEGEVRCRFPSTHGRLAEDLAAEADLLLPDLVVVGVSRRTFGGLSNVTPHAALAAIRVPVACVPETLRPPAQGIVPTIATVLVGTDLSDFANQAIPAAYSLLRGTGGRVEICYVYERGAGTEPAMDLAAEAPPPPAVKKEIEARLAQLAPAEASALGITTEVRVVEAGQAADGLIHEGDRIGADVLVVASHGRTGIPRAVLGSVSERVVRHGTRPVLVLYPRPR